MNRENIYLGILSLALLLTIALSVFNLVLGGITGVALLVLAYTLDSVKPVRDYSFVKREY